MGTYVYKYIYRVDTADHRYVAIHDHAEASIGDLVVMDNGIMGTVNRVVMMDVNSQDYALLTDFVEVRGIVEIYHHWWSKSSESEET